MVVTVLFYKLFQFKADLTATAIVAMATYFTLKFILTTVRVLTCSSIQTDLLNCSKE